MTQQDKTQSVVEQEMDVPFTVGSRVALIEDSEVEVRNGEVIGGTNSVFFEDWVDQHIPETGLLSFRHSDIGRAEFMSMLEDADGFLVMNDEQNKKV